jgi:hypothetical protein
VRGSLAEFGKLLASADERVLWAIVATALLLFGYGAFAGWRGSRDRGDG